jgi:hypothetical protein
VVKNIMKPLPTIDCDTVFALCWDTDYKAWTISDTLAVWHERAQPVDLYHVRKSDLKALKEAKSLPFTRLFEEMIFCVQDEDDEMYLLAPHQYNEDDIAFIITDGEMPVVASPSA